VVETPGALLLTQPYPLVKDENGVLRPIGAIIEYPLERWMYIKKGEILLE